MKEDKNDIPGISEQDIPALVAGARVAAPQDPLGDFIADIFGLDESPDEKTVKE